jgi:hypothetical protein
MALQYNVPCWSASPILVLESWTQRLPFPMIWCQNKASSGSLSPVSTDELRLDPSTCPVTRTFGTLCEGRIHDRATQQIQVSSGLTRTAADSVGDAVIRARRLVLGVEESEEGKRDQKVDGDRTRPGTG